MKQKKYCLVRTDDGYKILNLYGLEKYMDFFEEESPFDGSKVLYGWYQKMDTYGGVHDETDELGEPIKYSNSEEVLMRLERKLERNK